MPELPEVETVSRFVDREARGGTFTKITFFRQNLREAIPVGSFRGVLLNQPIRQVFRRSKYILIETKEGYGIFHLGMTGNLIWDKSSKPRKPHTHLIMKLDKSSQGEPRYLHFIDPRRFGQVHAWVGKDWDQHPYMQQLGPEPLVIKNLGGHLFTVSRRRRMPIKTFIMDGKIVVGVGNIYACEALYTAGISPLTPCGELDEGVYKRLGTVIKSTLRRAIAAGGTSFRDFRDGEGKPGYFAQKLRVYGREGEACFGCKGEIKRITQAGRSSWYCTNCQK